MHFESLAPNNNNYSLLKRIMDSPAAPALHINGPPIAPAKVPAMVPITALAAIGIPAAPKKKISEPVIPKSDTALRAPFFKEELRDMCVKYRANATFVTKVVGHPKPVVKWYKNGKEISPDGEKIKVQEFKGGYFQLVISNADENDAAVYQIRATNQLGSISTSMNLDVEGK